MGPNKLNVARMEDLYKDRPLSEGYPGLRNLGVDYFKKSQGLRYAHNSSEQQRMVLQLIGHLERLINLKAGARTVLVLGCGPEPYTVKTLLDHGYDAVGAEVLAEYVDAASEFLEDRTRVYQARAESLPFESNSKRIVLMESLLEHVDSPAMCLSEAYRVLAPGGVLFVTTTNKLSYTQGEYRVRFFNWLPALVQECYVFQHLHFRPNLANYSPLPAVHWFTYSKLCALGRDVGFGQFYSFIDLLDRENPRHEKSLFRRWFLKKGRYNPWFRALALTHLGGTIFMLKRADG